MRKIVVLFVLITVFAGGYLCAMENGGKRPCGHLLNYSEYKKIKPDNIRSLEIVKYTEAGAAGRDIEDEDEITKTYNYLSKIKLKDETQMSCTDNTVLYRFTLKDGSKVSIEFECDRVVLSGKNYNFSIR